MLKLHDELAELKTTYDASKSESDAKTPGTYYKQILS